MNRESSLDTIDSASEEDEKMCCPLVHKLYADAKRSRQAIQGKAAV